MKYFMVDIESMGTDFERDDIIQIAFLELNQNEEGFYIPGRAYCRTLFTAQKANNPWIANTHRELLEKCRKTPMMTPAQVRTEILSFFRECGVQNEPAMLMGLNATTFDVPYLVQKGFLQKPIQGANNKLVGDYHYRIYELKGAFNLAQDVLGIDSKKLFKLSGEMDSTVELPEGKSHEALYDCFSQIKTLNGITKLLRRAKAVGYAAV